MRKLLIFLSTLLLLSWVIAYPVYAAAPSLSVGYVGGKGLNPEVSPGESYTQNLLVSIGKNEPATDVLIEILGYQDNGDGIKPVPVESDTSPYSARSFIQPGRITVHCEPGEAKTIPFEISIPANSKAGGRYATLRFTTIPPTGGNGVATASSIVLPIRFTITGGPLIHTGEITNISFGTATSGKPVDIFTSFKNTGNQIFKIKGQIEIMDSSGKLINTLYINDTSPVPEETKQIKTTFIPKQELSIGKYSVESKLSLEDGTSLGEATGSFDVKAPYVPPPPPASITLNPSLAANLYTTDGRISIDFPQGAVTSEAKVSLQNYPVDQLPATPNGYTPAVTCFRVDGLNGLLAKTATVSVKYSSADLAKAGGNASELSLARWDESTGKWSVLKTAVDQGKQTLTASTNQFSLWAVMVGQPAAAVNWSLIGALIGMAVLVLAGLLLVIIRRKR